MEVACHLPASARAPNVSSSAEPACNDRFCPSEYTALLIRALCVEAAAVAGSRALEIGFGSGVVLGALGKLGAAHLCGVDIEPQAAATASRLIAELGYAGCTELFSGHMWSPIAGRRFDLIVANLPHFPTEAGSFAGRLPSWSSGGPDGRDLLDGFIERLPEHLAPGGRALVTHNAFVDIGLSHDLATRYGLELRIVNSALFYIPNEKLRSMTRSIRQAQQGRTVHLCGPHGFGEVCIVEFRPAGSRR